MIPIYSPPKKAGSGQWIPPAVVPPALIVSGASKHNSVFDGTSIWFTNSAGSTVYKYDINTLTFQEFPTRSSVSVGLAFDGTYIYVGGFNNNWITKLNLSGVEIAAFNSGEAGTHQILYDPTTDSLFATGYWTGYVAKLSKTGAVLARTALGDFPLGITDLGDYLYVACFDFTTAAQGIGKIVKLDKATLSIVGTWNIGVNPSDITTDGTNLWVTAFAGGFVYKVNPTDGSILATYNTGIPDSYQTTIRHIGNGWNILAITVTKDYQGDDLAGTYNKIHFLKESDGVSFQVSDAAGYDLRNGSMDNLNWVWFGGYADGSVTRILLETLEDSFGFLLHFSEVPIVDSFSPPTTFLYSGTGDPALTAVTDGFAPYALEANTIYGETPIYYLETTDNSFGAGDFSYAARVGVFNFIPSHERYTLLCSQFGIEVSFVGSNAGALSLRLSTDGSSWTDTFTQGTDFNWQEWVYILIERIGNTVYFYFGRPEQGQTTAARIATFNFSGTINTTVGRYVALGGRLDSSLNGYDTLAGRLDEVRLSRTTLSAGATSVPIPTVPFTA